MNMIFNASAGTGKTWQVTELYSALVLGRNHEQLPPGRPPVAPEKILLMTFTDNAAAELRSRVSGKMLSVEKSALGSDDELADRSRRVLRSLPAAYISTIHAFCAGLLREHALELGLSPAFKTLDDEERDALLDEVLKAEIFKSLEADADFREFCAGVAILGAPDNSYSLINTVRALLEKAAGRGLDLCNAEAMLPVPERTVRKQSFERICAELETFDLPKTAADALDALKAALADFPNPARIAAIPKFGQAKKVKHLSDELAEIKERFLTEYFYEQNAGKFRAFARCLSACARGFDAAKRSRDAVDFGDQLLLARDLLRRGDFSGRFDWIIVDEVQDTSRVQCEVIEALWGKETRLVVCGDRKQSIYAWRSADPQVMPDLEAAMTARGGVRRIDLKTSFRSNDRVISAVNALFSGIYERYDALEPQGVQSGEKPCVEFLMQDGDESTTEHEMAAVARRIRLLVDGGAEWRPKFGHNGRTFAEGEPFRYGDILILLKRSTHQSVLEKALRDAGIPYTSGGKGRALFEQQEVRDLLLFLQTLCEPANDLALVGFLRSPFANVPDETIVRLGWDGETFDHEILRRQFFESGSEAAERLLRYRALSGQKLASQLIRDIVRETAFDAQLAGLPGGGQRLANFKKALDWIRAAERGGQVLLPDVVRRFEKYIQTPPRSGAAEALLPDPEQNAVTLMTVHGAKGLTQRVCFVPDISFGENSEPGFAMFSPEGRLEMKQSGLAGEEVLSPGWEAARAADKTVRELELTNVFYVAMTRARDLVVLSGAGTQEPKGWLKLSEAFLQSASPDLLRRLRFDEIPESEGVRPEALGFRQEIEFQPLQIPKGLERRTVTSLVQALKPKTQSPQPAEDRRAFGSLGHTVLEELAKNKWNGDIPALVEMFSREFGAVESGRLIRQLEAARELLRRETAGAAALLAEYPFVLKRGDVILDGTMDLLVQFPDRFRIFDYKFSGELPENALNVYAPQLAAYKEAVEKLHPGAAVSATLVLIGESVRTAVL